MFVNYQVASLTTIFGLLNSWSSLQQDRQAAIVSKVLSVRSCSFDCGKVGS